MAPLTEPFDGKPSEAMQAGYCGGCGGTGRVHRFVPYEGVFPCSTCLGSGVWPPTPPIDAIPWYLPDEHHEWPE